MSNLHLLNLENVYQQLEFIRHNPSKAKSFEEVKELCEELRKKLPKHSLVSLLQAYNYMRVGCFEEALDHANLFFDFYDYPFKKKASRRTYSTLKHGLVLSTTLHRLFGSYNHGVNLLNQALANAQDNHNITEFRFCLAEERAYNLNALTFSMTPSYRRKLYHQHQLNELKQRFLPRFHVQKMPFSINHVDETFNNMVAAGFAVKKPKYKAISQHLRIMAVYFQALHHAISLGDRDQLIKLLDMCLDHEISSKWLHYGRHVQESALAIRSTMRLADGSVDLNDSKKYLERDQKHDQATEGKLIQTINCAYSFAFQGEFDNGKKIIDNLKNQFPYEKNPMLAFHWRLAENCILFDKHFFAGEFKEALRILPELEQFSTPEYIFRKIMVDFVYDNYYEADLAHFLSSLHKCTDPHLKIRCRIALGNMRTIAGNIDEAIVQLERSVKSARKSKSDFLEAAALRRCAYAYIQNGDLEKAEENMRLVEEKMEQGSTPNLERFLYFTTWMELFSAKRQEQELTESECNDAFGYIKSALKCVEDREYPLLEHAFYCKTALFLYSTLKESRKANDFAKRCITNPNQNLIKTFNWFLL